MRKLDALSSRDFAVIDLDSGTVLGTNLRVVRVSDVSSEQWDDALSNDSDAWEIANTYGHDLWVERQCPDCGSTNLVCVDKAAREYECQDCGSIFFEED